MNLLNSKEQKTFILNKINNGYLYELDNLEHSEDIQNQINNIIEYDKKI